MNHTVYEKSSFRGHLYGCNSTDTGQYTHIQELVNVYTKVSSKRQYNWSE